VLSVTTTPSAWKGTSALAVDTQRIRTGLGLHPQLAHERQTELASFDSPLHETRYVGEIGLDGSPELRGQWQSQLRVFEHILSKCREAGGKILSLHSRRASSAVMDYLQKYPGAGTPILHWFSGSLSELKRAIALGCWFSVGPAMLENERGRKLVSHMPRHRILTESDGPFAQLNGVAAMPWHVERAIEGLTPIWMLSGEQVEQTIDENLKELLGNHAR
jgi:TatD DNase family protein